MSFIGKGLTFPLDVTGGRVRLGSGLNLINSSLRMIIGWAFGTRFMRYNFGSKIQDILEEPNEIILTEVAYLFVKEAIERWEPRVILQNLEVYKRDEDKLDIAITYTIRPTASEVNFKVPEFDDISQAYGGIIFTMSIPLNLSSFIPALQSIGNEQIPYTVQGAIIDHNFTLNMPAINPQGNTVSRHIVVAPRTMTVSMPELPQFLQQNLSLTLNPFNGSSSQGILLHTPEFVGIVSLGSNYVDSAYRDSEGVGIGWWYDVEFLKDIDTSELADGKEMHFSTLQYGAEPFYAKYPGGDISNWDDYGMLYNRDNIQPPIGWRLPTKAELDYWALGTASLPLELDPVYAGTVINGTPADFDSEMWIVSGEEDAGNPGRYWMFKYDSGGSRQVLSRDGTTWFTSVRFVKDDDGSANSLTQSEVINGRTYPIRKLSDGKIWFLENYDFRDFYFIPTSYSYQGNRKVTYFVNQYTPTEDMYLHHIPQGSSPGIKFTDGETLPQFFNYYPVVHPELDVEITEAYLGDLTDSSVNFYTELSKEGRIYYGIFDTGASTPDKSDLFGYQDTAGNVVEVIPLDGMAAPIKYRVYYYGEDLAGNETRLYQTDVFSPLP